MEAVPSGGPTTHGVVTLVPLLGTAAYLAEVYIYLGSVGVWGPRGTCTVSGVHWQCPICIQSGHV